MAHYVILNSNSGFFSNLIGTLHRLYDLEPEDTAEIEWTVRPEMREEKPLHFAYGTDRGENAWLHFFEPLGGPRDGDSVILEPHQTNQGRIIPSEYAGRRGWRLYLECQQWRHDFHALYCKWVRVRPHITERVDRFYQPYMAGRPCVGIHYRCPAGHIQEEPAGKFPTVAEFIQAAEEEAPANATFFLATDDALALEQFRTHFGERLCYQDVRRWHGEETEVHVGAGRRRQNGPELGDEVLSDSLLLARCGALVHTSSNVATAVGFLNPHLKLRYIGGTDRDIVNHRRAIQESNPVWRQRKALQEQRNALGDMRRTIRASRHSPSGLGSGAATPPANLNLA